MEKPYGRSKVVNHTLLSSSAVLATRSVYGKMIYVNFGLNGA